MSSSEVGFKRIESLTPEQLQGLTAASKTVTLYHKRYMRMGINGISRPSMYQTCSLFKLPIARHQEILKMAPGKYADNSVVRYFLQFEPGVGFLDGQTYWMNKPRPIQVVAYALTDNNQIRVSSVYGPDTPKDMLYTEGNIAFIDGKPHILDRFDKVKLKDVKLTHVQTPPKTHTFNKGEGFILSLDRYHEILKQDNEQLWFCMGVMHGGIK